jgi:hypothetical protein
VTRLFGREQVQCKLAVEGKREQRDRCHAMPLSVGTPAPDVVFGLLDEQVSLSRYWHEKPVVVAFLRHFG